MRSSARSLLMVTFLICAMLRMVLAAPVPSDAVPPSKFVTEPTPAQKPSKRPQVTPTLPWTQGDPLPLTPPKDTIMTPPKDTIILGSSNLTLEDCLTYARTHHPSLLAAQARYSQALARMHISQAAYVPNVQVQVNRVHQYTQNGGSANSTTQLASDLNIPLVTTTILLQPALTFSYQLFDGGKRHLSVERDRVDLLTYVLDWRSTWRKLALQIELDYLALALNRALLAVQMDNVKMSRQTLQQAEGLFRAGKKTRLDALQARTDLLSASTQLNRQMGALNRAWATLEADVGVPLNQYTAIDPVLEESLSVPPREGLVEMAFKQRSDVVSYANQIAVKKLQIEVNKTALRPTLQTILSYGYVGADFPLLTNFRGELDLAIPLTSRAGVNAQNEEVLGAIRELLENAYTLRLQIIGNIDRFYISLKEAEERVRIATLQVEEANRSYQLAFKRYKQGISEFIEVTNARNVLNNARNDLENARNDRMQAEMNLLAEVEMPLKMPAAPPPRGSGK